MTRFHFFKKIYFAVGLIFFVILVGIVGFMVIEKFRLLDAFYMTIITIATVGFGELHPLSDAGKLFTATLIITSIGIYAYSISIITNYIIDGEFAKHLKLYRLNKEIQKLENHVVVCGYGRNGKEVCAELTAHHQSFVVIENAAAVISSISAEMKEILIVDGDATKDETLVMAGIQQAKALITALPNDADNVYVVLTAREMNPDLLIISRASDDASDKKLRRAGANNVIMPDKIGGSQMASLVVKPDVIEFIDYITGAGSVNIRLEEIKFDSLPKKLKNKTIKELEVRNKSGANIIGLKKGNGEFLINPSPDTVMLSDTKLFVLGTKEQVSKLLSIFAEE